MPEPVPDSPADALGAIVGSTLRLDPFPDELVMARDKERAIRFLLDSTLPPSHRAMNLNRWGKYTGVQLSAADFARVRALLPSPGAG